MHVLGLLIYMHYLYILYIYLFIFWVLCLSPYVCTGFSIFFFLFGFICLMGLIMEQKLYFRQHFSHVIVLICCFYLI